MSIEVGRIGDLGQKNTDTDGLYRWIYLKLVIVISIISQYH